MGILVFYAFKLDKQRHFICEDEIFDIIPIFGMCSG